MKRILFLVFLLPILLSCTRKNSNIGPETYIKPRIKKQVMDIAVDYAREKFKNSQQSVQKDGTVCIGDNQITDVIDPATIVTGLIDDDSDEDAIIMITSYKGRFQVNTEHLILIKTGGKFKLTRVVEAVMKIIRIKDSIIFAEISKFPPDSPSYGCEICKEVVKYQYRDGNLVRTE
jgi:hypothetical protein